MSKKIKCFLRIIQYVSLIYLCFSSSITHANNLRPYLAEVEHFTVNDGLADNTIYSIAKDNNGFLFLGTPNGLSRYDGHRFENFTTNENNSISLLHQNAGNITIDSRQRIWIGSWGNGLYLYDKNLNLLRHFSELGEGKQTTKLVQVVYEDSEGDVWIGTNGGGLALYQNSTGELRYFVHQESQSDNLSHNRIWDIQEGSQGQVWVATGGGLDLINKKKDFLINHYTLRNRDSDNSLLVRTLYCSEQGQLWAGTENGLFILNDQTQLFEEIISHSQPGISRLPITHIEQGKDSEFWIGTQNGLLLYNKFYNAFVPLVSDQQYFLLSHYDIRALYYDDEGILWVASRTSGLVKLNFGAKAVENINYYLTADGRARSLNRVQSMLSDSEDTLWIGSTEGLMIQNPQSSELMVFSPSLDIDLGMVATIMEQASGTLWFGSNKGIFKYEKDRGKLVNQTHLLTAKNETIAVASIFEDSRGTLWVGTYRDGLFRIEEDKVFQQKIFDNEDNSTQTVLTLAEDHRGYIWVGTSGSGAIRLSPYSRTNDQYGYDSLPSSGLSSLEINQIFRKLDNSIWIGTNNKLNKLDSVSNAFINYDHDNGLQNTTIKSLVEDSSNNLWISTSSGIYKLDSQEGNFVSYTEEKTSNSYISRSSTSTKDTLYFGQIDGFTKINISEEMHQNADSLVVLSGVSVDNKRLPFLHLDTQKTHKFEHTAKELIFHFANTNNFRNAFANNYSFRLLGYDSTWSPVTQSNHAEYRGLSPGKYTFEVKVIEKDGSWDNSAAQISFQIMPPWWETLEFRAAVLLILGFIIYYWNQHRLRRLKAINAELEEEVASRSKELIAVEKQLIDSEKNASLSSLVSGIAHEINTPVGIGITASSLLTERTKELMDQFNNNKMKRSDFTNAIEDINNSAELISSNLNRTSALVENFKKVSVDQVSQQKRHFNLKEYLQEIAVGLSAIVKNNHIDFTIICDEDIWMDSYPGAIAQMLTQLMLNAATHAFDEQKERTVKLKAEKRDEQVVIYFHDNGRGIPDKIQSRIFDPFFTTERNTGSKGLGLQIVANVVTIRLQGQISFESNENEGTCFHIEFALNPE
ncbi:MAG: sensor histidine kinase [Aliiglaciecola sp.]